MNNLIFRYKSICIFQMSNSEMTYLLNLLLRDKLHNYIKLKFGARQKHI